MECAVKVSRLLIAALGAIGFSGVLTPAVHAQTTQTNAELVAEAERECERALEANTLEAFLAKYKHVETGCLALALEALGQFGPNGAPNDEPGNTGVYPA